MGKLELLEKKITELAKKTSAIKRENQQFISEGKIRKGVNSRANKIILDNEGLIKERNLIKRKISELLDRYRQAQF